METSKPDNEDILKLFAPIADTFKVAVTELWGIFVRQYTVQGVTYAVAGIMMWLVGIPSVWWGITHIGGLRSGLEVIAFVSTILGVGLIGAGGNMVFRAIPYLGNPAYHALDDVLNRIKNKGTKSSSDFNPAYYRYF